MRIVTDSTADLPKPIVEQYGIRVVPLKVHFGADVYRDGVDLAPEEFYRRLRETQTLPTTSQPSPGEFMEAYRELTAAGDSVVSIHLSAEFSGTYQSAVLARQMVEGDVELVDTGTVTMGLGLVVVAAARAAAEGKDRQEVAALASETAGRVRLYALLDTLQYLEKGGRITKVQFLIGALLNAKPILTVEEGVIKAIDKVYGKAKGMDRLAELCAAEVEPGRKIKLAILHSDALDEALALRERLEKRVLFDEVIIAQAGPVVGTHAGPGAVGAAFYVCK